MPHDPLTDVHVTILAGGSGTRLWPLSRHDNPKQLLGLFGDRSLIQQTADRLLPLVPWDRIYVLTGPDHVVGIREQLPEMPLENLFIEPSPKNTAPCLGLAAMRIQQRDPEAVMVSVHADHVVMDGDAFPAGHPRFRGDRPRRTPCHSRHRPSFAQPGVWLCAA